MTTAPPDAADYEWPHPPTLADRQRRYLKVREHTLSTAAIVTLDRFVEQARYVLGEAGELRYAVRDYVLALDAAQFEDDPAAFAVDELQHVRHEIADVVLAATALAGMLPGGVTVERCIDEKTEADRGRG